MWFNDSNVLSVNQMRAVDERDELQLKQDTQNTPLKTTHSQKVQRRTQSGLELLMQFTTLPYQIG